MKICAFTNQKLEMFRNECNFTDLELQCFNLKAKNKTNTELSMELNICDSTVSTVMKSIRAKITTVLDEHAKHDVAPTPANPLASIMDLIMNLLENSPLIPESHTTEEWAEMPDKVSIKNKWYVVSDYRTDNDISVPRFKYGDGITLVSQLPFVTAAITDNDVEYWDKKAEKIQ